MSKNINNDEWGVLGYGFVLFIYFVCMCGAENEPQGNSLLQSISWKSRDTPWSPFLVRDLIYPYNNVFVDTISFCTVLWEMPVQRVQTHQPYKR